MTYRPVHFKLYELVDPRFIHELGERAWTLLRPDALMMLDALRDKFGTIVVNDGRIYKESGLRWPDTTTGAKWSMHKYGGAFDCKPQSCTPKDMYDYILAHQDEFQKITRMESIAVTGPGGWVHFDVANTNSAIIEVFNPQT